MASRRLTSRGLEVRSKKAGGIRMKYLASVLASCCTTVRPMGPPALILLLASGSTLAQESPDTAGALEEITVTAQFVRQNLQETPVAITALSAATLESRGHETIEQIANQTPN